MKTDIHPDLIAILKRKLQLSRFNKKINLDDQALLQIPVKRANRLANNRNLNTDFKSRWVKVSGDLAKQSALFCF